MKQINSFEYVFSNALSLLKAGRFDEASTAFLSVLKANPNHFSSLQNLAICRFSEGRIEEALSLFRRCTRISPSDSGAWINLSESYARIGKHNRSLACKLKAVRFNSNSIGLLTNTARQLHGRGFFERAACLYEYLASQTSESQFHINALICRSEYDNSEEVVCGLTSHSSNSVEACLALANYWQRLGAPEKAIPILRGIGNGPESVEVSMALAAALLSIGDFKNGFSYYEQRPKNAQVAHVKEVGTSRLRSPKELSKNKRLFILAEQGIGDTVMFLKILSRIDFNGAYVYLVVDERLINVLNNQLSGIQCVSQVSLLADDLYIELGSIPFFFETYFPASQSQRSDADVVERVVICPRSFASRNGWRKSIAWGDLPSDLQELITRAEIITIVDQPETWLPIEVIDSGRVRTVSGVCLKEAVSEIKLGDLIISASNSYAHLAGFFGIKTVVLLHEDNLNFWYWRLVGDGGFSLIYPKVEVRKIRKRSRSTRFGFRYP